MAKAEGLAAELAVARLQLEDLCSAGEVVRRRPSPAVQESPSLPSHQGSVSAAVSPTLHRSSGPLHPLPPIGTTHARSPAPSSQMVFDPIPTASEMLLDPEILDTISGSNRSGSGSAPPPPVAAAAMRTPNRSPYKAPGGPAASPSPHRPSQTMPFQSHISPARMYDHDAIGAAVQPTVQLTGSFAAEQEV